MWAVLFDDDFEAELDQLDRPVQRAIATYATLLAEVGPQLGRPYADTIKGSTKGSTHANMKELRPTVNKVEWRIAYAFDTERQAILLAAAAKGGEKDSRVYARLIKTADERFSAHLDRLAAVKPSRQR
jgi:hypothetical protein